ncbi:MAG: TldD/PmbA family protein [Syntrophomonadaceae bacterium]|jgi:TldD protein|nr:TldD/PmbA family protein [Syntrophomonadaceae bacterium]
MLEKRVLSRVLEEAMKKGGDFAEIYVEEKTVSNIFYEDDKIEKINSGREKGAGIRVIKDGSTAYVYTNDLSTENLCEAASLANHAAESGQTFSSPEIKLNCKSIDNEIKIGQKSEKVSFADKIERIISANSTARNYSEKIRQVTIVLGDVHKAIQIANSDGELVEDERARVRMIVNAVAAEDNIVQTGYESAGEIGGWELLSRVSLDELAANASGLAVKMLSAPPAPAGRMPVVMSAEAGGTLVHEACGHGLEADLVQKGLSVYKGQMGQKVAASGVTIIDDATIERKFGSFRFDDEGIPGQKTVLIENGRLCGYLYDRLTAQKDNTNSTGNGRRQSYQHKPIPRMTNTFIAPGKEDPSEIIKSTPQGLLVKKMGGGQVNTTNGDFVFDVQEAYIIEDGEVKHPVRGATLTGNGPEVLKNIDRMGKDLGFGIGTCGKDGQGVPVSDAQPTIRIKQLTVGGTMMSNGPSIKRIRRK